MNKQVKTVVQRTYKVRQADKNRIKSLRRDGESNYGMLERIGKHVVDMDLDDRIGKNVNMRLDFPHWVFELLSQKAKETGIPMIQIIRQAATEIYGLEKN